MATESTNTAETQTGGSGKTIALVLAAVAVVLFILGLMGDYAPEGGGLSIDPMSQFEVSPLLGGDELNWFVPSNVTLWMGIAIAAVAALLVMGTRGRAVIPGRSQSMAELVYGFVHKMVEDVAGKDALPYFPYIFTAFLYIVFANVLGLIPASFTTTSHAAVTVTLALTVFISVTVIGFAKNGVGFLSLFWLTSAPLILRPVLAVIEVILYFARPVSHSVRLFGAIAAGHAVMKVFAGFAGAALIAPLAIAGMVAIYALELLVAVLQAYVFTILTCVYLKDALHPHH